MFLNGENFQIGYPTEEKNLTGYGFRNGKFVQNLSSCTTVFEKMSPVKKIVGQKLPKTFPQKPIISTSFSSSGSEENSPIKTPESVDNFSPTKSVTEMQSNLSSPKSFDLPKSSTTTMTFKEQLEQKLQQQQWFMLPIQHQLQLMKL